MRLIDKIVHIRCWMLGAGCWIKDFRTWITPTGGFAFWRKLEFGIRIGYFFNPKAAFQNPKSNIQYLKSLLCVAFFVSALGECNVFAIENSQFINVVNRAIKKDHSVFSNSYLADQFFRWHKKNPFSSFEIDTVFYKDVYREVWINLQDPKSTESHNIAMLMEGDTELKIVEIRTLMSPDNRFFTGKLAGVIGFIERFLWIYETGDEGFIYDFIYPDYIKLKYSETENTAEILALLKKQYPYKLPVSAVELENRDVKYRIDLKLQLPLVPLQIAVDIQKYMTARYFELKDKKTRFGMLRRSLNNQSDYSENHIAPVIADSPHRALNIFLETYFDEYNVNILQREDSFLICEANLLPIFDHLPAGIQYRLQAKVELKNLKKTLAAIRFLLVRAGCLRHWNATLNSARKNQRH